MARIKGNTRIGLLSSVSLLSLMLATQAANANPEGGVVEAGSATIVSVSPTDVSITQTTDKAIINWDSFDISVGEMTEFILPSSDSITLNRDFSGDASEIYGTLISNGKLYLINRSGILFGSSAVVDVAGLVASTHDISSEDFLNGNYAFTISGDSTASVVNMGQITIDDYGIGAFVAPHVRNDGVIAANMGKVSLASASGFAIDLYGDSLISFLVENPNEYEIYDKDGNPISSLVENNGSIIADGGQVVMTAAAARGIVDSVINMDGVVQANTVGERNGKIVLGGGSAGIVKVAGQVTARGDDSGETGGHVTITGELLYADAWADIDASGILGGGTILFGGDYLGGNATDEKVAQYGFTMEEGDVQTARMSILEDGARLAADALSEGDGGKVVVWSDEATITAADISAKGGAISGDGGFIETSGKYLDVQKTADASVVNGDAGTWLIDPLDITIGLTGNSDQNVYDSQIDLAVLGDYFEYYIGIRLFDAENYSPSATGSILDDSIIEAALNTGTSVNITTYGTSGSGDGDITLAASITKSSGGEALFILDAAGDINVVSGVDIKSTSGKLWVALLAEDGSISANNIGELSLNGGGLALLAQDNILMSSIFDMPNLAIIVNPNGNSIGDRAVAVQFDDDVISFGFNNDMVLVDSVHLVDTTASGQLYLDVGIPYALILTDLSLIDKFDRAAGWFVEPFSMGVIKDDALNGIPEAVTNIGPDALDYVTYVDGPEPGPGIVPVWEVSTDINESVDVYISTAPSGHAILDAYIAELNNPPTECGGKVGDVCDPTPTPPPPPPTPDPDPDPEPELPAEEYEQVVREGEGVSVEEGSSTEPVEPETSVGGIAGDMTLESLDSEIRESIIRQNELLERWEFLTPDEIAELMLLLHEMMERIPDVVDANILLVKLTLWENVWSNEKLVALAKEPVANIGGFLLSLVKDDLIDAALGSAFEGWPSYVKTTAYYMTDIVFDVAIAGAQATSATPIAFPYAYVAAKLHEIEVALGEVVGANDNFAYVQISGANMVIQGYQSGNFDLDYVLSAADDMAKIALEFENDANFGTRDFAATTSRKIQIASSMLKYSAYAEAGDPRAEGALKSLTDMIDYFEKNPVSRLVEIDSTIYVNWANTIAPKILSPDVLNTL